MPKVATSRPGEMIIASLRGEILRLQTVYRIGADLVASDTDIGILSLALLQCPLHIYSIFALRASNERYLDGGVSGSDWGFGQTVAMVLLGANFLSIADGITGYIEEIEAQKLVKKVQSSLEEVSVVGSLVPS
ncbi:hypothetical protein HBI56_177680 [Parastagonospora nodorum]|uniref:Uncharacterized protein n=1 Tax=Phaeosphaeria nodorum (strain SN15 / ATCC MYA-4574 / FGSC 10173) TaxID=321614 RepID=A0A7U2HVS6_PHANO|nr:hypothetical protein HBH56_047630 [Parastagonospora nodorum]QRC92518.1 hypothetical protein JI435_428340 [Parastagonospora nodorum SN15]KAH3933397.1 hypothetical protein HBH54_075370 [Parastagonospora nodorum]KAH3938894.1 hypothetical protein HBH53_244220 [Parastagonospora nodorum]KAH3957345.1 hypothetical protein HBH51_226740 [Parastagonospora nodorum]